jgi:hypothetical protein
MFGGREGKGGCGSGCRDGNTDMLQRKREGERGKKRMKGEREGIIGRGYDRDGQEDMMEWRNLQGLFGPGCGWALGF